MIPLRKARSRCACGYQFRGTEAACPYGCDKHRRPHKRIAQEERRLPQARKRKEGET